MATSQMQAADVESLADLHAFKGGDACGDEPAFGQRTEDYVEL